MNINKNSFILGSTFGNFQPFTTSPPLFSTMTSFLNPLKFLQIIHSSPNLIPGSKSGYPNLFKDEDASSMLETPSSPLDLKEMERSFELEI
jgi:hypothetical protein